MLLCCKIPTMRKAFTLIALIILFASCKKDSILKPVSAQPPMNYINLHDTAIGFGQMASFDLNGNGEKDVRFNTMLVGDALKHVDKKEWLVTTTINTSLPVDAYEQIPVMAVADSIPEFDFQEYHWYNASSVLLAQKVIGEAYNSWDGVWKDASHKFIPVQVRDYRSLYNGWIEISFSTTDEKLVLHKAAICTEQGRTIKAGE